MKDVNDLQELIGKINNSQKKEQTLLINPSINASEIKAEATVRVSYFDQLTRMYNNLSDEIKETRTDLIDELTVIGIVDAELRKARDNLNNLEAAKSNQNRMSEINTYYGKQYDAHSDVMILIIKIGIPLLILAIIGKKGYIGKTIVSLLALIIILVGGYLLIYKIWDLHWRSNMNYDEYDWYFDPDGNKPTVYEYDKNQYDRSNLINHIETDVSNKFHEVQQRIGCFDGECCHEKDGLRFNAKQNKCEKI